MNLKEFRLLVLVVTAVLALIVALPGLQRLLVFPTGESFSEFWLLGPEHGTEGYPRNITRGENNAVFLGVSNHLGRCANYLVQVKFRNFSQSAPEWLNRTPSSLASLYSVKFFVAAEETWELPVIFSFDYSYNSALSQVSCNRLIFNGAMLDLNGYSISWTSNRTVFFGDLFFELWVYNDTVGGFQYHERYVDLQLNMTV